MSIEKYIQGRKQGEHHFGMHSTRQRLESAMAQLKTWRNERIAAHEQGHSIDLIPQDEEIVLFERSFRIPSGVIFEMPEVKQMMEANKKPIDISKTKV